MSKINPLARDLRTPKYKPRVVKDKRKKIQKKIERREMKSQIPSFLFQGADQPGRSVLREP